MYKNTLEQFLDNSTDILCAINTSGKFKWLNDAAKNYFDSNNENFINQFHEKDRSVLQDYFLEIKNRTSNEINFQAKYSLQNGAIAPSWSFLWNEKEKRIYCLAHFEKTPKSLLDNNYYYSFFDISPCFKMIYSTKNFRFLDVNDNSINTYGYNQDEFLKLKLVDIIHPNDFQNLVSIQGNLLIDDNPRELGIFTHLKKDGSLLKMKMAGQNFIFKNEAAILLTCFDVTEQFQKNSLEHLENEMMENALEIAPDLEILFQNYIKGLGNIFPHIMASILKIEDEKVWNLASSLPKSYKEAIHGQSIGPTAGSCGTAAFLKKTIITTNINTDPLWEDYKSIALPLGLKACWSQPIFNSKKEVIATFANYFKIERTPSKHELEIFKRSATLIGIIFENQKKTKDLQSKIDQFNYVNQATNDAIYDRDIKLDKIIWGQSYQSLFGHTLNKTSYPLSNWKLLVHSKDLPRTICSLETFFKTKDKKHWQAKYRFKKADGTYAFVEDKGYVIRNKEGEVTRMIGVLSDISRNRLEDLKKEVITGFTQIFNNNIDLKLSLEQTTQMLLNFGGYSISEIWLTNPNNTELSLYAKSATEEGKIFYSLDATNIFKIGEGFPGIVWEKKQIVKWNYKNFNDKLIRKDLALKAKLKNIMGVPLIRKGQFIGVWVCADSQEDNNTYDTTQKIGLELAESLASEIDRKQLEESLSHIFQLAPDIICTLDCNGNFKEINNAGCELLEYSKIELLKMNYNQIIYSANSGILNDKAQGFYDIGKTYRNEDRYITKSGKILWLDWNCRAYFNEGVIYTVAKDVTDKKRLQNLLDDASKMAIVGSWELDLKNDSIYWSDITREILEAEKDYLPTRADAVNHYREETREKVDYAIIQAIKKGRPWDFEFPLITLKGNEKWVRSIGKSEIVNNKCIRIYGSFQDIHEKKIIELKLKNTLAEKKEILERIQDSFFAIDRNFIVTYWNNTAEEVLSTPKEMILGKNLWDIFSDAEKRPAYKYYIEALNTGKVVHFENFYPPSNRWFDVSVYPSETGASVYFKDISQKKIAKEKIEKTNELLKEIAWQQSHSVRAPVARLMAIIDVFKHGDLQINEKENLFKDILISAEELDIIIKDITRKTKTIDFENK